MARRHVLTALVLSIAAGGLVATPPAGAGARNCSSHPPRMAGDYQAVANERNANFGVGDLTSAVQLPDGRRFFTFGDTGYYSVAPDGHRGPFTGFANNSAWVQSGNCFTLLDRAGPGARSWLLPPQRDGSVYWPGASVVVGTRLYVFLNRVVLERPFGRSVGSAVAAFDLPSLALARITTIPFRPGGVLGIGAVYEGGFVYAYSSRLRRCAFCFAGDLYVARVRETMTQVPAAWRYRSGSSWTADPNFDARVPTFSR